MKHLIPCVRVVRDSDLNVLGTVLLPLPVDDRDGEGPSDPRYWIKSEEVSVCGNSLLSGRMVSTE